MSELPELTLDEIFTYCFFRDRASVFFNKDRDLGIFVVRFEFPLTEPRNQRKFLWILYHPYSFDPIDSIIMKIKEAEKSLKIIRVVDDKIGEPSMVFVVVKKLFKKEIIKYDVSANRILLPGDILAFSSDIIDFLRFTIRYYLEGKQYIGYFALFANRRLRSEDTKNPLFPSLIHSLLILGATRVVTMLESVSVPSVYEVIKREIMEDYHELVTFKYTIFGLEELKKLEKLITEQIQSNSD